MPPEDTKQLEDDFFKRLADFNRQNKSVKDDDSAEKSEPRFLEKKVIGGFSVRYPNPALTQGSDQPSSSKPVGSRTLAEARAQAFADLRELPDGINHIEIFQGEQLICSTKFDEKSGRWENWTSHSEHADDPAFNQYDDNYQLAEAAARSENHQRKALANLRNNPPSPTIQQAKLLGLKKITVDNPAVEEWKKELIETKKSFEASQEFRDDIRAGIAKKIEAAAESAEKSSPNPEKKNKW